MKNPAILLFSTLFAILTIFSSGCERDLTGLSEAPGNTDPLIFDDNFGVNVEYGAFQYSDYNALSLDTEFKHSGTTSLKVTVPDKGSFAGGAFYTRQARDFTVYNALTFWARASKASLLNTAGLGNDNTGTSKYMAEWQKIPLDTSWKKYIIPIPNPERLRREGGLFFFAEEAEGGTEGHEVWFDEIRFENLEAGTITNPRPEMDPANVTAFVGGTVTVGGTSTIFSVNGTDQEIIHMPGYLTFISSNEEVVQVNGENINVVGVGTADITAVLGTTDVQGIVELTATAAPLVPAPDPDEDPADVISLFSGKYNDINVESWSADWPDMADVQDFQVGGNDVKVYTNLFYAGILFENSLIDATDMDYFHIDVWVPDGVILFKVKLVDFGEDGTFGGAPDSYRELTYTATTDPPLLTGQWVSFDIPLEDFMNGPNGLIRRDHLAQLLVSGHGNTAFIDNVYFYRIP